MYFDTKQPKAKNTCQMWWHIAKNATTLHLLVKSSDRGTGCSVEKRRERRQSVPWIIERSPGTSRHQSGTLAGKTKERKRERKEGRDRGQWTVPRLAKFLAVTGWLGEKSEKEGHAARERERERERERTNELKREERGSWGLCLGAVAAHPVLSRLGFTLP